MNVFENEPRPTAVGGGWRLRFAIWKQVARLSLVAASFQSNPVKTKGTHTLTPCKPAENGWMRIVEVDADSELGYLTLELLFIKY
jgi:hypothetical protein